MLIFKELYAYREMIAGLVRKDLKGRYKGSVLGFLWTFLNPLLPLLVSTFAFQIVLKNPAERYYMHLFSALVPWIFFSSALTTGSKIITGNSNMIKKIYFPSCGIGKKTHNLKAIFKLTTLHFLCFSWILPLTILSVLCLANMEI